MLEVFLIFLWLVQQLNFLILNRKVDIVLICETFLKPHHKFKLNGYKIYRNDRATHGGGVAIAIKYGLQHSLSHYCPTVSIENISISVCLKILSSLQLTVGNTPGIFVPIFNF